MPNKYNLNISGKKIGFTPSEFASKKIITIEMDESWKKEPVVQISGKDDIQILYYYGRILIYKFNNINYFAVELNATNNSPIYFLFLVEVTTPEKSNSNSTSVGNIISNLDNTTTTKIELELDLNSMLINKTIKNSGNVYYVDKLTISYTFPTSNDVGKTLLPGALSSTESPDNWDEVKPSFVKEEIQWVLDCNSLGEDGKETADVTKEITSLKVFIYTLVFAATILAFVLFAYYLKWILVEKDLGIQGFLFRLFVIGILYDAYKYISESSSKSSSQTTI